MGANQSAGILRAGLDAAPRRAALARGAALPFTTLVVNARRLVATRGSLGRHREHVRDCGSDFAASEINQHHRLNKFCVVIAFALRAILLDLFTHLAQFLLLC